MKADDFGEILRLFKLNAPAVDEVSNLQSPLVCSIQISFTVFDKSHSRDLRTADNSLFRWNIRPACSAPTSRGARGVYGTDSALIRDLPAFVSTTLS